MNLDAKILFPIVFGISAVLILVLLIASYWITARACRHLEEGHLDYYARLGSPRVNFARGFVIGSPRDRAFQIYIQKWLLLGLPKDYPASDFICQDLTKFSHRYTPIFKIIFAVTLCLWLLGAYLMYQASFPA